MVVVDVTGVIASLCQMQEYQRHHNSRHFYALLHVICHTLPPTLPSPPPLFQRPHALISYNRPSTSSHITSMLTRMAMLFEYPPSSTAKGGASISSGAGCAVTVLCAHLARRFGVAKQSVYDRFASVLFMRSSRIQPLHPTRNHSIQPATTPPNP